MFSISCVFGILTGWLVVSECMSERALKCWRSACLCLTMCRRCWRQHHGTAQHVGHSCPLPPGGFARLTAPMSVGCEQNRCVLYWHFSLFSLGRSFVPTKHITNLWDMLGHQDPTLFLSSIIFVQQFMGSICWWMTQIMKIPCENVYKACIPVAQSTEQT